MFRIIVFSLKDKNLFSHFFQMSFHVDDCNDCVSSCEYYFLDIIANFVFESHFCIEYHLKENSFKDSVSTIIIDEFRDRQLTYSVILLIIDVTAKILFQCLILSFSLLICLRIKRSIIS